MPSHTLKKQKILTKKGAHIVQLIEQERVKEATERIDIPDFKAGDILQVKMTVPENRRRTAKYKGICIARRNRGVGSSFTIRNVINGRGFEIQIPLYSPLIQEIQVVDSKKVRRGKLYYLRDKALKFSRF
mmetsp:Transcript_14159/g.35795  ORF Transcript_14159/g.35795 Transcript_14159/m.35795 type:complete len:130 (+) Transcript_14159:414-803(+)